MAKTSENAFVVLTANSINEIVRRGGVAYWVANAERVSGCKYVIATRNRNDHQDPPEGNEEHGAAFFVGEIGGGIFMLQEPGYEKRIVVGVTRFARVNKPGVWTPRGSNPVRYASTSDLPIDFRSLKWEPWPRARAARGLTKVVEL